MPSVVNEPPVDPSREHYEECALAIALAMASTPEEQATIEHLTSLRAALMEHRLAHSQEAIAKRHARGEIYSKARVAALDPHGPSREEMDANVRALYMEQGSSKDVLRVHARTHFASALVSKRHGLALMPDDIAESAREMQVREETFAQAWIDAVGDSSFADEMHALQREAKTKFRTPSRPIYQVTPRESRRQKS